MTPAAALLDAANLKGSLQRRQLAARGSDGHTGRCSLRGAEIACTLASALCRAAIPRSITVYTAPWVLLRLQRAMRVALTGRRRGQPRGCSTDSSAIVGC